MILSVADPAPIQRFPLPTIFVTGLAILEGGSVDRKCGVCGSSFETKRRNAKYCSDRCRKRAQRVGVNAASDAPSLPPDEPSVHVNDGADSLASAAREELAAAGRESTATGRAVLALARRIDSSTMEPGSSLAALVREFRASMAEAVKGAEQTADPVDALRAKKDELRARRERKHTG